MDKKDYSVKEVLNMLDISRTTLYSRLSKYEHALTQHISNRNGKKYISLDGIDILKDPDNCSDNLDNCSDNMNNQNNYKNTEIVELLKEHLDDKDSQIIALNNQLKVKDNQIKSLSDALNMSQKLNENNQILLSQTQQKILFLEQTNNSKKPWWKRLFK